MGDDPVSEPGDAGGAGPAPVVVYSGSLESAHQFAAFLIGQGIYGEVLDRPNLFLHGFIPYSYRFRVAVAVDQVEAARRALDAWIRDCAPRVAAAERVLLRQALLALAVTALAGGPLALAVPALWRWVVLVAFFLVAMVVIGQVGEFLRKRR